MAISLKEALATNNNEANSLFRVLKTYSDDGNIHGAARGGFTQEVVDWYNARAGGKSSDQLNAEIKANTTFVDNNGGGVINDPNDPGQLAYNERLAAMGGGQVYQGGQTMPALGGGGGGGSNTPQLGTTAYTNYLLGGNYFGENIPGNPTGQLKPFTAADAQANNANYTGVSTVENFSTSDGVSISPNQAISPDQLNGNTTPVKTLPIGGSPTGTTKADSTFAGAETTSKSIDDYIKMLTGPETEKAKESKGLMDSIKESLGGLMGRGESQLAAEEAQQVNQKKQVLLGYQTELQQKTAEYKALQAKYQALNADIEGKPITMNSIIGAQAQVNRVMQAELNVKASEIAMVQANVAGAQGNLALAQDAADRYVDLKYSDAKDIIDIKLKQLELVQGETDKEETIRANAITLFLADQKEQIAKAEATEKQQTDFNLDAMQSYPSANIKVNDSYETTQQKIVVSKEYQLEIEKAQPNGTTSSGQKILGNSTTGYYTYNPSTGQTTPIANPGGNPVTPTTTPPTSPTSNTSLSSRTNQVIDGLTKLSDLTPTEAAKVRDELYIQGFGSDTVPAWFKNYIEAEKRQSLLPSVVQQEWTKYRKNILGGSSSSGTSINDI